MANQDASLSWKVSQVVFGALVIEVWYGRYPKSYTGIVGSKHNL